MVPGIFKIGGDYSDIAASYRKNVEARRKAADAAFEKYFTEQSKTLDPNVIRPQDRDAFDEMFNEWKQVGIANKKLIMSDPRARMEHERMLTNISRFAQDSKARTQSKEPLFKMLENPDKKSRINETVAFSAIDAHDQPLMIRDQTGKFVPNPNSKPIDYKQNFWNPKPIDLPKFFQDAAFGKKQVEVIGSPIKPDIKTPEGLTLFKRYEMMQPIKNEYTLDTKKEIGNNAFKLAQLNPEIGDAFEVEFKNISKKDFDDYSKILKDYFPNEELNSGASLAKATALKMAQEQDFEKSVVIPDKERIEAKRVAERNRSEYLADRRARAGGGGGPDVNVFDVIDATYSGGTIQDGSVLDKNGNRVNGSVTLSRNQVPAQLSLAMKGLGIDVGFGGVDLEVEDGQIKSVTPKGFAGIGKAAGRIDRDAILIGQQKIAPKANWGKSGKPGKKKDTLDLGF